MPRAYPEELKQRVVDAYNDGEGTYDEIAERFKIGRATVNRALNRERTTGSVAAFKPGGARHETKVDEAGEQFLRDTLVALPDSTLVELVEAYEEQFGVTMHQRTMGRTLVRMGISRKRGAFGHRRRSGKT